MNTPNQTDQTATSAWDWCNQARDILGMARLVPRSFEQESRAKGVSVIAFAKLKLVWEAAKKNVQRQLAELQSMVLEEFNDSETAAQVKKLDKVLKHFNRGLGDKLDALYNAGHELGREHALAAQKIANDYLEYLSTDGLVLHVQNNPFMKVAVTENLEQPLEELHHQLDSFIKDA